MKRFFSLCLALAIIVFVMACGNKQDIGNSTVNNAGGQAVQGLDKTDSSLENSEAEDLGVNTEIQQTEQSETTEQLESVQVESSQTEQEEENNMTMNILIGDNVLTATLVQNSSTEALIEMLSESPVTIEMNDYASMEKVGPFPQSLPRNDERISTGAGDLILYQGNSFVIYYDTNSWNFTRLGKIDNVTQQELKDILGSGSVTAVLSLPTE